jgi:dienelactone hydrolase
MKKILLSLAIPATIFVSCADQAAKEEVAAADSTTAVNLKEENVTYKSDTTTLNGFIVYNSNSSEKRPAVLVVPEWWGLNEYPKQRARQLAELGYIAMAVDFYGNGKNAANPQEAGQMATPFYQDPQLVKSRIDAALSKLKEYSQVDTSRIAAIGYCFGGSMVLTAAKLGENFKGVVSFHGGLAGIPPKKELLKSDILVCHGEADSFVPEADVVQFKKSLDSINAPYTFKSYANATHAFTNPAADENARNFKMPIAYNAAADSASWNDMKTFFGKIFK